MDSLQKEVERELLDTLGVSDGYSIIDIPSYFINEYYENTAYKGGAVPEDFVLKEERHLTRSREEKDLWINTKLMERAEEERTNPLASPDPDKREEGRKRKGWGEMEYEREIDYLPNEIIKV